MQCFHSDFTGCSFSINISHPGCLCCTPAFVCCCTGSACTRAGWTISQELQQIPGSSGSPTTNCKPSFPTAHPRLPLLNVNTLMDASVQDKAETLLDSRLIAMLVRANRWVCKNQVPSILFCVIQQHQYVPYKVRKSPCHLVYFASKVCKNRLN